MKLSKSLVFSLFLMFFLVLVTAYSKFSAKIPVSYWDEMHWVGQSYLFQHFIQGNFSKNVWDTRNSYDHATLAKFVYGAWLYPEYLSDRKYREKNFDYTKFLISKGFFFIDGNLPGYQKYYRDQENKIVQIDSNDSGFTEFYLKKYGNKVLKTINLILRARTVNFYLLALAVLLLVYFLLREKGLLFSVLFFFLYGFNSLIIRNGIKAHSEAVFMLLFNSSLILFYYYFLKQQKTKFLILFSVFTGLTMATKINGIMLLPVFIVTHLVFNLKKLRPAGLLAKILWPSVIILSLFTVLNPYTYPNPPLKIINMFKYRYDIAAYEAATVFQPAQLQSPGARIIQTFVNFYDQRFMSNYNLPFLFDAYRNFSLLLLLLFILGIIIELKLIIKGNTLAELVLCSFIYILIIMSFYLHLNWDRYFIHLVFFFIYYQVAGIVLLVNQARIYSMNILKNK